MLKSLSPFFRPDRVLMICGIVSLLLLAGAHAFERIGNLAPCALCLDQREVHWVALAVCGIGSALWLMTKSDRILGGGLGLAAAVFAYSAWLAGYHAGVEWKFWPGPPTCTGGAGPMTVTDTADLVNQLDSAPIISCTDAAWRMFGISMAGYNAVISFALMLAAGYAVFKLARRHA